MGKTGDNHFKIKSFSERQLLHAYTHFSLQIRVLCKIRYVYMT